MSRRDSWTWVNGKRCPPVVTGGMDRAMISYTRGYILALEDLLRDIEHMGDDPTVEQIQETILDSLSQSHSFLDALLTGDRDAATRSSNSVRDWVGRNFSKPV